MHAICKNNELKYNIFINPSEMIPLELRICFLVMHTWLLPSQNDLHKNLWRYVKLKFMIYDVNYLLHFQYNPQYTTRLWL